MKLKLMGHTILVKRSEKPMDGSPGCVGSWSWEDMAIRLKSTLTDNQTDDVFIHELIEAINSICELDLPHPVMTTMASALHSFHVQNRIPVFGDMLRRLD